MIKNDGAWAKTTNTMVDTNLLPVQQASAIGNLNNYVMVAPYGYHYNAPVDTLCATIDNKKRVAMATSGITRIPVESGEVIYFHPITKTRIHMKNNGDVQIQDAGGTTFTLSNGKVTVKATNIELDGDVAITGNLNVDGQTALGSSGLPIARVGDTVATVGPGLQITSGSANNTAN